MKKKLLCAGLITALSLTSALFLTGCGSEEQPYSDLDLAATLLIESTSCKAKNHPAAGDSDTPTPQFLGAMSPQQALAYICLLYTSRKK